MYNEQKKDLKVLSTTFSEPGVYESENIEFILSFPLKYFGVNDIVIFDIDDVLITDRFNPFYLEHFKTTKSSLAEKTSAMPLHMRYKIDFYLAASQSPHNIKIMDEQIPTLIKTLQEKGVKCMANTALAQIFGTNANFDYAGARVKLLKELDIDFSNTFSLPKCVFDTLYEQGTSGCPPLFTDGILFSSKILKSITQKELFSTLNLTPKKLLFIDDRIENVQEMYHAMTALGIDCYCFCYSKKETVPLIEYFSANVYQQELKLTEEFVNMLIVGGNVDYYFHEAYQSKFILNLKMEEGWTFTSKGHSWKPLLETEKMTGDEFYKVSLRRMNENVDYYLRKILLPNKYQEMQQLINKYKMSIKIIDDASLKSGYKKIALETHPDKTVGVSEKLRADMQKDFIKADNLLKQDTIASSEIYKPVINKLYNANLFIKIADTSIDITKGFIKPTLENGLKISIDCMQLSAMYYGSYGVMLPIAIIGALYQIYNDDYEGAVKSVITSAGITFMSTAVYAAAPALSVTFTAGFTGYAGYTMLKNGYELYYEWYDIEITNNLEHKMTSEEIINYD